MSLKQFGMMNENDAPLSITRSFSGESITEIFNNLVFLISLVFQASLAIMLNLCGKRSAVFKQRINRYNYGVPKNFTRLVRKLENESGKIYSSIIYGYLAFTVMNLKIYQECSKMKNEEEDTRLYFCGVYSRTWYPIPLDFVPVKHILLVLQVMELFYFIPKASTAIVIFHGSVVLIEERINDLKRFIRRTKVTESNADEVKNRLLFAVKNYAEIDDAVKNMNSTLGLIFSPLQHAILLGLLVFLEFRIILERNMESIPLLIFWSSFQCLICWRGQCLENASSSLQREVYEFPWYNLHPSSRSLFKIFYRHVQLTLKLRSPPFITLNMRYYYEVMKGSYSFLMFLHRF
ncbi:uncharacterized protein LOC123684015 [Harmonia axyridis]|uniref:uncharacterized protein LOC123684015 n=1 Tax=Harmonia axyridis TaxID=115357 RepID=UPI001E27924E|nr:uncharacterized protein LOC123684015 [Harmonia axyridis]